MLQNSVEATPSPRNNNNNNNHAYVHLHDERFTGHNQEAMLIKNLTIGKPQIQNSPYRSSHDLSIVKGLTTTNQVQAELMHFSSDIQFQPMADLPGMGQAAIAELFLTSTEAMMVIDQKEGELRRFRSDAQFQPKEGQHHGTSQTEMTELLLTSTEALPEHKPNQAKPDVQQMILETKNAVAAQAAETEAPQSLFLPLEGWFSSLFQSSPKKDDAEVASHYREQGILLVNKHCYRKAIKMLKLAMDKGIDDIDCHLHLGLAYTRLGRLQEAISLLTRLKDHHPNNPGVATLLGKALLFNGQYLRAVQVMEPLSAVHFNRFNLHFYLGLAYAKLGEFGQAIQAWTIASVVRPDHEETQEMIARAWRAKAHQES